MITKTFTAVMLSTALLTGAALAENTTADRSSAAMMHKEGEWRSSKLIGVDVYNAANEKIGSIEELILGKSGRVENVVLGVGGFLGMGEHYVAVAFDKLKWSNEPVSSSTAATKTDKTTTGTARAPASPFGRPTRNGTPTTPSSTPPRTS